MATTIKRKPEPLSATTVREGSPSPPAAVVSAGIGTAGCNRGWKFGRRLGDAGHLDRLQCLFCYDFNRSTIERLRTLAEGMRGSPGTSVLVPGFVRAVDGFLRRPRAFQDYYGLISADLERMLAGVRDCSETLGAPPQLVVEFLGFGGHSILGGLVHGKLATQLPEATFLPVLLLPSDPTLHELARQETWREYERHLAGQTVLLTDNAVGEPVLLDDKLAIGLASVEAAACRDPSSGTLAETVATLTPHSNGWLGMSVLRRRLPSQKSWGLQLPLRQRKLVRGRDNDLAWLVKNAVKDSMKREAQLAHHEPPADDVIQRGVVTVPLREEELGDFKDNVISQLKAEGFFQRHPKLALSFCGANFPDRPDRLNREVRAKRGPRWLLTLPLKFVVATCKLLGKSVSSLWGRTVSRCADEPYLNVARVYPIRGPIQSLEDMMGPGASASEESRWTGFGSLHYLNEVQDVEEVIG